MLVFGFVPVTINIKCFLDETLMYKVKEIFKSYQGEGYNAGSVAVFVRFAKCNLWSGSELDRNSSVCKFCDTDFLGGVEYSDAKELVRDVESAWGDGNVSKAVILTGGEPLLSVDCHLVYELKRLGYKIWVETNGTVAMRPGVRSCVDWTTVSPKAGTVMRVDHANELKLVYPQAGLTPTKAKDMLPKAVHLFLQPKHPMPIYDEDMFRSNCDAVVKYCIDNPEWKISVQTHKIMGVR